MLTISDLVLGYNNTPVLHFNSTTVARGEHCLLLGKSGSGKTTLLYAIAGLLAPLSGTIRLDDVCMTELGNRKMDAFRGRTIGIIYQTLHMVSALTVLDNILLAQYAAGIAQDAEKARLLLAQLGIDDYCDKKPEQLSQGQQQRVAIARAAINSPKLILGDEPTSALDDESCDAVMQLLLGIAKTSGASLVIATHDARIKKYFSKTITLGGLQ